jgi:alpha-galactosidase/6-phospho-beta-glucosidase family protein
MYNICVIGASSLWSPTLVTDLMAVFQDPLDIRLIDINPDALQLCQQWGEAATKHYGRKDKFTAYTDRRKALEGADAVIITISTGGLESMRYDIEIPEKYGIYATVGDTAGPGGWSRAIRNIPVFQQFAQDFDEICPTAFIINYTNPMSALTATLAQSCRNPVVGLCHSYFEMKDVIQHIFNLDDWNQLSLQIAGMNHFTWLIDFKIGREDGYTLLREKIGNRSLRDLLPQETMDEKGYTTKHNLCAELYDTYGYLPYPGDRHTCEFLSYTLSGNPERHQIVTLDGDSYDTINYCNIKRTSISHRQQRYTRINESIQKKIIQFADESQQPIPKSPETVAEMLYAYLNNKAMTEVLNTLNVGQIPGLPLGACVETFGIVDGLGARPVIVNNVPEHLLEIMRPQAINQKWVTEGAINRNKTLLLQSLYNDPQCKNLKPGEMKLMADELFTANKKYISL